MKLTLNIIANVNTAMRCMLDATSLQHISEEIKLKYGLWHLMKIKVRSNLIRPFALTIKEKDKIDIFINKNFKCIKNTKNEYAYVFKKE